MRDAFAKEMVELGEKDHRIVLLSGDIGNRLFNPFRERFPNRFYNCGVAEANMMTVAAGMGLSGLRPFVYTIVPFVTTRCLEQIRVDVCYHHSPVTIVGVGGGLSYAGLGPTHHACDDISFLRQLPGMTVVCPADPAEVRLAIRAALASDRPAYIRLGRKGEPVIKELRGSFTLGRGAVIREGADATLISTGHILPTVLAAANTLTKESIEVTVVHMPTVKPLDADLLDTIFATNSLVVTIEEHSVVGGLGSAIAEWINDHGPFSARLLRIGTSDEFLHAGGSEEYMRHLAGLDEQSLVTRIVSAHRQIH